METLGKIKHIIARELKDATTVFVFYSQVWPLPLYMAYKLYTVYKGMAVHPVTR